MGRLALVGSVNLLIVATTLAARSAEPPVAGRANLLAKETSPYLRQHAHSPVDWHPWGPEALERAARDRKLILLSIGYSSCHWCHVMERETFANAEVARMLNESFVCIKVDREERPDIDQIYQTAVQMFLRNQPSGWPLSVFLTPDAKPLAGSGMFLPPDDRTVGGEQRLGFKSFVRMVLTEWRDRPAKTQEQADVVVRAIGLTLNGRARASGPAPKAYLVSAAVAAQKEQFDVQHGGFGNPRDAYHGPKFPLAPVLDLLSRQKSDDTFGMVTRSLDHMAAGGIYDQIGGGFHRYSTDRTWAVPHFEKMLADNAQLVVLYARAFERTRNPLYRRIVAETLEFVSREMTSPDGGFYTALDADSDGEEGRFYVWLPAELDAALPDSGDRELARVAFGIGSTTPTAEDKYVVLIRPNAATEASDPRLAAMRQKLFAARAKRSRPFLDTKIVTAWNGQMIAAFAVAGRVLAEPKYITAAARAAEFLLAHNRSIDGRLLRSYSAVPGEAAKATLTAYLDDFAFLIDGLLCLHEATADARWLTSARELTDSMIRFYGDDAGGFFLTASDHERLLARAKFAPETAQPSGNAVAARDLLRLAAKTGESRYRDLAERTLRAFTIELEQSPAALPAMAAVVDDFLGDLPQPAGGQPAKPAPKQSDKVVNVTASADKPGADGKQTIKIKLVVDKDWHAYANPVGNEGLESAQTTVTVSGKAKPKGVKIDYPQGKIVIDPIVGNYNVYEGTVEIKAVVQRAAGDSGPLDVSVKLQACNDKMCLPPATVKLSVP
jgi:uncharacterized protein YyaL (SSP411 family)